MRNKEVTSKQAKPCHIVLDRRPLYEATYWQWFVIYFDSNDFKLLNSCTYCTVRLLSSSKFNSLHLLILASLNNISLKTNRDTMLSFFLSQPEIFALIPVLVILLCEYETLCGPTKKNITFRFIKSLLPSFLAAFGEFHGFKLDKGNASS